MKKNLKTNLIAYLLLLTIVGAIIAVLMNKATLTEATGYVVAIGTVFSAFGFFAAKDAPKTDSE